MTDLELQDAVIREIRKLAEHQSLKKIDGEVWKDFNIYRQDKPYKNDVYDDGQEDYIVVMLDNEDIAEDGDGRWVVMLHIIINLMYEDPENQGNVILANLMNQIDLHFRRLGYLDGRFEMMREAHKCFDQEHDPTYVQCDYITTWKLPPLHMEDPEDY